MTDATPPFTVELACNCQEWLGNDDTLETLKNGYRMVCPECHQDLAVKSSPPAHTENQS